MEWTKIARYCAKLKMDFSAFGCDSGAGDESTDDSESVSIQSGSGKEGSDSEIEILESDSDIEVLPNKGVDMEQGDDSDMFCVEDFLKSLSVPGLTEDVLSPETPPKSLTPLRDQSESEHRSRRHRQSLYGCDVVESINRNMKRSVRCRTSRYSFGSVYATTG